MTVAYRRNYFVCVYIYLVLTHRLLFSNKIKIYRQNINIYILIIWPPVQTNICDLNLPSWKLVIRPWYRPENTNEMTIAPVCCAHESAALITKATIYLVVVDIQYMMERGHLEDFGVNERIAVSVV
jgi:hypothetical protein